MKGSRSLSYIGLGALLLSACGARDESPVEQHQVAKGPVAQESRPNIVLIMADDLGYGDISPFDGRIVTPNLDRMAAEGLRLTDFHTSGTVCSPTRAGLMTGRYQQRAGIPGVIVAAVEGATHEHGLKDHEVTLPELMKESGYETAIFGKWHLGYMPIYNPLNNGFDTFSGFLAGNVDYFSHVDQSGAEDWWKQRSLEPEEGYATHLISRDAVSFIEENSDKPFFLYVSHASPHYPYQGPNDGPERVAGGEFDVYSADGVVDVTYAEMVDELDRGVGEILDTLVRAGIDQNTLVLFFSDNGANEYGSNAPYRGHKTTVWEGGHRVPFIAWWPESIEADASSTEFMTTLDIMPTILELTGANLAEAPELDGRNVASFLLDGTPPAPQTFHWNGKGVREGDWKLVITDEGPQLFDLATDPGETTDVSASNVEQRERMLVSIAAWEEDVQSSMTEQ